MQNPEVSQMFKMILYGGQEVGKSSILQNFTDKKFDSNYSPTIGIEFGSRTLEVNGEKVKIQCWDTAGQERYSAITQAYFKGSSIVLYVYDITNKDSLSKVKNLHESSKSKYEPNSVIGLVGNKNDLEEQRNVTRQEAIQVAEEIGAFYFGDISAASLDDKMEELFINLAIKAIEKKNC